MLIITNQPEKVYQTLEEFGTLEYSFTPTKGRIRLSNDCAIFDVIQWINTYFNPNEVVFDFQGYIINISVGPGSLLPDMD